MWVVFAEEKRRIRTEFDDNNARVGRKTKKSKHIEIIIF